VNPSLRIILALSLSIGAIVRAEAYDLTFASVAEGRSVLTTKDDFVERMSPFDRAARLKTDREVSEAQYLAFVASAVREWGPPEKKKVTRLFRDIRPRVRQLGLPLPDQIHFIKTSGDEEGEAAYTRQNAIILPANMITESDDKLRQIIAHELFHVSSRQNPSLSEKLYGIIGFHHGGEVVIPPVLAPRKITNPDAPRNNFFINLTIGSEKVSGIPVLLSTSEKYDVARGGQFFDYLEMKFLLVKPNGHTGPPEVLSDAHGPRAVGKSEVAGFYEQIGKNTDYIIHPEEILADNFALLVVGARNLPSPLILQRMQAAIADYRQAGQGHSAGSRKSGRR